MTTKPPEIRIPFEFTSSGYDDPSFDVITRGSGSSLQDLTAAVKVIQFERDRLKSCKTYIVGYDQFNVQILKQDCVYEGIRDLHAAVASVSLFYDLPLYIKSNLSSYLDLATLVKGASNDFVDLVVGTKGWSLNNTIDLSSYIRQGLQASTDFTAYVKTFLSTTDTISSSLKGWKRSESDTLFGVLKGLKSEYEQISSYIKPNFSSTSDLSLDVFKIWHQSRTNVLFDIHGWQETNLLKYICALAYQNLPASVRATYLYDLVSTMVAVPPLDLAVDLYGWAVAELPVFVSYAAGPGDLNININAVIPKDLSVVLNAFMGVAVSKNLVFKIQSYYTEDLSVYTTPIPAVDLPFSLVPKCFSTNLAMSIYPKVVYVRTLLSLSYLECIDLAATINSSCFNTSYKNLAFNLYSMHSSNLKASLFGTDGSNISDLSVFINDYDYYEENSITVKMFKDPIVYTSLSLHSGTSTSYTESNVLQLKTMDSGMSKGMYDVFFSIDGAYLESNLTAFIRPYTPLTYNMSSIKEKLIVLKINHTSFEEWRRHVEITFDNYVRSYYYFSGNQKVYREFIDDQWVVQVKGYSTATLPEGIERSKVNRKYIFNLKKYSSIDAAIKDMIDRVTALKEYDLRYTINGVPKKEANLSMSIASRTVYKSNRRLPVSITPI